MRWSNIFAASSLLVACESASGTTPDRPAPDAADDLAAEAAADAAPDAPEAADVPCVMDVNTPDTSGARYGFLRFAHLGRGMGRLRFVARSLPAFAPAHVEAVVGEGEATEQIQTLPVAYEIHVTAAGDAGSSVVVDGSVDGGVLTDGAASPATACTARREPGDLVDPICSDVYFFAGCTVLLFGSPMGQPLAFTHQHLQRSSDLPQRTAECDVGYVRTGNFYAGGPLLDTDIAGGGRPLARSSSYRETSGIRAVPAGPLRVAVREPDGGASLGEHAAGVVTPGHTHTLYLWGDRFNPAAPGLGAILLDEVSPTFR